MNDSKNNRRRGEELLESLYDAAIELTATINPAKLTFQQIAEKANTSRTVLYRRWDTPLDLLQDIYAHRARALFNGSFLNDITDNGSLKADFFQLLSGFQNVYQSVGAEIINNYYYLRMQDKNNSREPAVHNLAVEKYLSAMDKILEKAKLRGDKVKQVNRVTLMLPYDLMRTENLLRPENINEDRLNVMIDEILLPVFVG